MLGPHRLACAPIADVLRELRPETLVVDAFPGGIRGELDASVIPPKIRTVHLARLLRWAAYRDMLPVDVTYFDQTWVLEELTDGHAAFLAGHSGAIGSLTLTDPPSVPAREIAADRWLIAHAGPLEETTQLLAYARECAALENVQPRLLLAAPSRPAPLPADVDHIDDYPVWPLFASAARVFTAAGFNAVRQMAPWRHRHRILPFARRWDDQFARAARVRPPAAHLLSDRTVDQSSWRRRDAR
ncbi:MULTISPECIES: hypothetical protein [unclassified Actinoplanes]|uniref:hypothetical protein n=1 Tax=unclassified Actinoplanes TaxID=2626549 RepID=UPI0018D30EA5|nr:MULTISPECIES: hypothetical protein [unclassified Actinoplanes]